MQYKLTIKNKIGEVRFERLWLETDSFNMFLCVKAHLDNGYTVIIEPIYT